MCETVLGDIWLTGKMQVADTELGAFDVHRKVDLAPARQVLDVAIAAMLWTSWNSPGAFFADLVLDVASGAACVHVLRLRRQGDVTVQVGACLDELALSAVPFRENFSRWCTS